jgi:dTDP-4-dehydrorhamnose reductase
VRIIVIGREGQVARALIERAPVHDASVISLARPVLDLADPSGVTEAIAGIEGDLIVNAGAYTAVDQAESEPQIAQAVNGAGAGAVASAAAAMKVPVIHLSTDYVFDGTSPRPYREDDEVRPLGVYGSSKLLGEQSVAEEAPDHVILRTAWVYSPFGKNFLKTMLRLAENRDEIAVVSDQVGAPTSALDIADGIIAVGRNLLDRPHEKALRGTFHMTGSGCATWAEFAVEIFKQSAHFGGPGARVRLISTAEYPTPARRPPNSRLDCTKLARAHGVTLPDWRSSLQPCIKRLVDEARAQETHR